MLEHERYWSNVSLGGQGFVETGGKRAADRIVVCEDCRLQPWQLGDTHLGYR
jgi:hypothetical protein